MNTTYVGRELLHAGYIYVASDVRLHEATVAGGGWLFSVFFLTHAEARYVHAYIGGGGGGGQTGGEGREPTKGATTIGS